jgi:hypothetical protein
MTSTNSCTEVHASREIVLRFASDPALLAEWNNEYIECGAAEAREDAVIFSAMPSGHKLPSLRRGKARRSDVATWTSDVSEHGSITHVAATIEEHTGVRHPLRWLRTKWQRPKSLAQSLARLKGFAEADARDDAAARLGGDGLTPGDMLAPGDMVALLNVYTGQFASYTTLLWQVPALGLTAQAFLMTMCWAAVHSRSATRRGTSRRASP